MKKFFEISKMIIFGIGGIMTIIFHSEIANYLGYVVGGVAIYYGVIGILESIINKTVFSRHTEVFDDGIYILLGILLATVLKDKVYEICIVWAVWSILRETREFKELLYSARNHRPFIISTIESIVIIIFSVFLIIDPQEHMHTHIILLSVEFLCQDLFKVIDFIFNKVQKKKKEENETETVSDN